MKTKSGLDSIDVAFEIKSLHDDDEDDKFFIFEGLASTFGNLDLVGDIIMPGAFKESIKKQLPVVLWQHNTDEPIGMPIEIREVKEGLFIKVKLPKDDVFVSGRVMPQLRVGSIKRMSIGFHAIDFEIDHKGIRRVFKVLLEEVSLITFAANLKAEVTDVKSINVEDVKTITTRREFETYLREVGFSKSAASFVASNKFNESLRGDPAGDDIDLKNSIAAISSSFDIKAAANQIRKITQKVNSL